MKHQTKDNMHNDLRPRSQRGLHHAPVLASIRSEQPNAINVSDSRRITFSFLYFGLSQKTMLTIAKQNHRPVSRLLNWVIFIWLIVKLTPDSLIVDFKYYKIKLISFVSYFS